MMKYPLKTVKGSYASKFRAIFEPLIVLYLLKCLKNVISFIFDVFSTRDM